MTRALCLALALAQAEPQLTPSPDFERRVVELEKLRSRALGLRLSAGVGYALAFGCIAWVLAELIAGELSKNAGPLSGQRYRTVVPPLPLILGAVVFGITSVGLHLGSRSAAAEAAEEEADLERWGSPTADR